MSSVVLYEELTETETASFCVYETGIVSAPSLRMNGKLDSPWKSFELYCCSYMVVVRCGLRLGSKLECAVLIELLPTRHAGLGTTLHTLHLYKSLRGKDA